VWSAPYQSSRAYNPAGNTTGTELVESTHVGAEYIVAGTTKTIDAMGAPNAYKFWDKSEFLESIGSHLKKSIDYVAIDLKALRRNRSPRSDHM
jgi:hypothetical protein